MDRNYPTWLNEEFVQKVLRLSEKDDSIKIISMHLSRATEEGDNFCSLLFRAKAEFKRANHVTESKALVVKVMPDSGSDLVCNCKLDVHEMFENESSMMMDTLMKMNQLLSDGSALSAKAFYSQNKNPVILVVEDLVPRGFRMIKRGSEIDTEHFILAIRNLAKFHASSVALGERNPSDVRKYNKGFYHANQKIGFWQYFEGSIRDISRIIAELPTFGPRYAEKILKLQPHAVKKAVEVAACKEGEFSVLCHGDLWTNNIMYRYDDSNKPIENIFVDFQMPVYTSPAFDLHYIFATSLRDDSVRDDLLIEYHATLESTMSRLNCQTAIPSLEGLKKILRDRGFFEVVFTLLTLPIVLQNREVKCMYDINLDDDNFGMTSMRSEIFLNILKERILRWEDAGLLDTE